MNFPVYVVFFGLCTAATLSRGGLLNEISDNERGLLASGQIVVKAEKVPGAPWPRLSLYQVVDAPPAILQTLFGDYAAAPTYTPNLMSARVIATNPDGTKDVEYTVKVPILMKTSYTVRNSYIRKGSSYTVSWKLLKSPFAKISEGSLSIEPYGADETLMRYTNLVVPKTNLVAGLKAQALNEAKATVVAIKTEAERRARQ